jgi:hypothetical protein
LVFFGEADISTEQEEEHGSKLLNKLSNKLCCKLAFKFPIVSLSLPCLPESMFMELELPRVTGPEHLSKGVGIAQPIVPSICYYWEQ